MKDLLVLLGKRVHALRAAKKWSQEEFAAISGLHRTYIGQIERGEKNISFGNLVKVSAVLGVTASELLSALDAVGEPPKASRRARESSDQRIAKKEHEIQKLVERLRHQRKALDRTLSLLEEIMIDSSKKRAAPRKMASGSKGAPRGDRL